VIRDGLNPEHPSQRYPPGSPQTPWLLSQAHTVGRSAVLGSGITRLAPSAPPGEALDISAYWSGFRAACPYGCPLGQAARPSHPGSAFREGPVVLPYATDRSSTFSKILGFLVYQAALAAVYLRTAFRSGDTPFD